MYKLLIYWFIKVFFFFQNIKVNACIIIYCDYMDTIYLLNYKLLLLLSIYLNKTSSWIQLVLLNKNYEFIYFLQQTRIIFTVYSINITLNKT
jgi:hypothetical protein